MSHSTGHGNAHGGHKKGPNLVVIAVVIVSLYLLLRVTVLSDRPAYDFNSCQGRSLSLRHEFELVSVSEPWLRAATAVVWGDISKEGASIGRGFLYVSSGGHLRLASVEHIIDQAEQWCTFVSFRDTTYIMPLSSSNFHRTPETGVGDRIAIYTLPPTSVENIASLLQYQQISPLRASAGTVGSTVAFMDIDDSRDFSYWRITEAHEHWYRISLVSGAPACSGDSGSAMLLAPNGTPTDRVIGAMSTLLVAYSTNDGRWCGTDAIIMALE